MTQGGADCTTGRRVPETGFSVRTGRHDERAGGLEGGVENDVFMVAVQAAQLIRDAVGQILAVLSFPAVTNRLPSRLKTANCASVVVNLRRGDVESSGPTIERIHPFRSIKICRSSGLNAAKVAPARPWTKNPAEFPVGTTRRRSSPVQAGSDNLTSIAAERYVHDRILMLYRHQG